MKVASYWSAVLVLVTGASAFAQNAPTLPTPLAQLVAEAEANNSQISAANHAWRAATHVAQQVTTLPDPKVTVQQFRGKIAEREADSQQAEVEVTRKDVADAVKSDYLQLAYLQWSGEYEFERAKHRLKLILPIVFFVIFFCCSIWYSTQWQKLLC